MFSEEMKENRNRNRYQMRNFRNAIKDCELSDLGCVGNPFTFQTEDGVPTKQW